MAAAAKHRRNWKKWSEGTWHAVVAAVRLHLGVPADAPPPQASGIRMVDWHAIAERLGNGRSAYSIKSYYRMRVDPAYVVPERPAEVKKHKRGVLKKMAHVAMRQLGGQATCPEVIECCRSDPAVRQQFWEHLNHHVTKVRGTRKEIESWEATISTNAAKYFRATGLKKWRHAVWGNPPSLP
ncbi:unnamed protein product [Prorocentrum cordatum]|uniref:Uncharacterized protein n=1 Tax=Prorocentrum cordatum TaxID=2364126 RepID=A0ABN9YH85_9DINO|nr:unnamed protein product [Polarella glacialis]